MTLSRPKAILLDWDNTLVNTWPIIHEALTETFEYMGQQPYTLEETKAKVCKSMRDSFPEIFGSNWEKAAEKYQSCFRSIHLDKLTPLPQAIELLEALEDLDIYVAIVSNKLGVNLRKEVTHINWDKYFDNVIGATDAELDKPYADPVYLALKDTGIEPNDEVWFIGDSIVDMECAHKAKCSPIFYGDRDIDGSEEFQTYPPKHRVVNHNELIDLIRQYV